MRRHSKSGMFASWIVIGLDHTYTCLLQGVTGNRGSDEVLYVNILMRRLRGWIMCLLLMVQKDKAKARSSAEDVYSVVVGFFLSVALPQYCLIWGASPTKVCKH